MQKIEELTLYVIEQNTEIEQLKKQVKNLVKSVYGDVMSRNKYFKFYLTKNITKFGYNFEVIHNKEFSVV